MRIFFLLVFCILTISSLLAEVTKNDKSLLPEVETTIDGKFIITYPNKDGQLQKKSNEVPSSLSRHETYPSLIPQTSITNLKDEKIPIMPSIGPLTAYGHPSTRYKSIDRDVKTSLTKNDESDESLMPEVNNDQDPDPFASQRKTRPFVVPDAYAAAPIEFKSPAAFGVQTVEVSTEKIDVAEKVPEIDTLKSVADILETFSPEATTIVTSTTSVITTATTTVPPTAASQSSTTLKIVTPESTTPSKQKMSSDSVSTSPIIVPTKSQSSNPNISNSVATNSSHKTFVTNETSAELLKKETFNNEASDYDNDVFERLKDTVLIDDNPRSLLSETAHLPTRVHPKKSNKFLRRQFAAPSEDAGDGEAAVVEENEGTDVEEIIPEAAFPLPNCYRTAGGFLCCNRFLEELIYRSNSVIQRKQLSECNIHAFAVQLQSEAEKMFKTTFEIIIGTGDFASKTRFKDNLICKTITDKKVILIYGTPEPYSLTDGTPLSFT